MKNVLEKYIVNRSVRKVTKRRVQELQKNYQANTNYEFHVVLERKVFKVSTKLDH